MVWGIVEGDKAKTLHICISPQRSWRPTQGRAFSMYLQQEHSQPGTGQCIPKQELPLQLSKDCALGHMGKWILSCGC